LGFAVIYTFLFFKSEEAWCVSLRGIYYNGYIKACETPLHS
jgi:hypothetical protein